MLEQLMMLAQDGDAAAGAAVGLGFLCFFGVIMLISLASMGLVIYALIDAIKNPALEDNRIIWILVILFVGPIGALVYLFVGKNK